MSWLSRIGDWFRRRIRRPLPEPEIPIEPEIQITPPIFKEEEKPIIPEPEKEEVEIPPEYEEIPEEVKEENLVKVVTFDERLANTRIRRTVKKVFPLETSEGEIRNYLMNDVRYRETGNYPLDEGKTSIQPNPGYEEEEVDRQSPGSADVSP